MTKSTANSSAQTPTSPSGESQPRPPVFGLRAQLLLMLLPLILGPLITVAILLYGQAREDVSNQARDQLASFSAITETQIRDWSNGRRAEMETLAMSPEVLAAVQTFLSEAETQARKDEAAQALTERFQAQIDSLSNRDFTAVLLARADTGEVVVATEDAQHLIGQQLGNDKYFRAARTGTILVPPRYDPRIDTTTLKVIVETPIKNASNEAMAVLLGIIPDNRLAVLAQRIAGAETTRRAYLVSEDGYELGTIIGPDTPKANNVGVRRAVDAREAGHDQYVGANGNDVIGYYRWLKDQNFALLVEQDVSEAYAPLERAGNLFIVIIAVAVVISIVGVLGVTRTLTQPIQKLTAGALSIAGGNLNVTVDISRRDEIGLLSNTFNWMARQLREILESLEQRVDDRTRELTQAQAHTQELLGELREASRIAALANFELDVAAQTLIFSDRFYELLGTSAEAEGGYRKSVAEAVEAIVHPDDAPRVIPEVQALLAAPEVTASQLEYRVNRADGETRNLFLRFLIERDAQGNPLRVKGAAQDITERKQLEETLAAERNLLRTLIDNIPDFIYAKDTESRFIMANQAVAHIMGAANPQALLGKSDFDFYPEEMARGFYADEQALRQSGQALIDREEQGLDPETGGLRWQLSTKAPLRDSQGNVTGLVGISRDITPRKQVELALAKRASELETVTQVATSIATIQNPHEMLQAVVDLVKPSFNLYHAHIYLLNEAGDTLTLAAGADEAGRRMVAEKRQIPFNREHSLVARAARTRQGVIANDVSKEPDFLPNPWLPNTRSELAVPLIIASEVLGVLDVQSDQVDRFTQEDVRVQTILAAQIAVALQNAQSLRRSEQALKERDELTRRLTREGWQAYLTKLATDHIGYVYDNEQLVPVTEADPVTPGSDKAIARPIVIHGEAVGKVVAADIEKVDKEVEVILDAVAQGLSTHIDNLRLSEQTQAALAESETLYLISSQVSNASNLDEVLRAVARPGIESEASEAVLLIFDLDATGSPVWATLAADWQRTGAQASLVGTRHYLPESPFTQLWIVAQHQPMLIGDTRGDPRLDEAVRAAFVRSKILSAALLPLTLGRRWIGQVILHWPMARQFTEADERLFESLTAQAAVVVNNRLLFEQTQKRADREAMINAFTQKIQSATSVESAIQTAAQSLGQLLKVRRTVVEIGQTVSMSQPGNGSGGLGANEAPHKDALSPTPGGDV